MSLAKKPGKNSYVVVATQGNGDEEALENALSIDTQYVGFVASGKKAEALREILLSRGITAERLEKVKAPAGLDIKARSPEEIALSIFAEIVLKLREGQQFSPREVERATDPICGMSVDVDSAKHVFDYQESRFYFCCEGCKTLFRPRSPKVSG